MRHRLRRSCDACYKRKVLSPFSGLYSLLTQNILFRFVVMPIPPVLIMPATGVITTTINVPLVNGRARQTMRQMSKRIQEHSADLIHTESP